MPPGSQPARELKHAKPLSPGRKAWFRQDGESLDAYEAFMAYLMLPADSRSQHAAAAQVGKSASLMNRWSRVWSWSLRVAAYEEHYLLIRLESIEADKDRMWQEQQRLANVAANIVESQFDTLMAAITDPQNQGQLAIKPDALVRLFDTTMKIQRMAVLGRVASAAEAQEQNERLAEVYAEELKLLLTEVANETALTPEQQERFQSVVKKHLVGG